MRNTVAFIVIAVCAFITQGCMEMAHDTIVAPEAHSLAKKTPRNSATVTNPFDFYWDVDFHIGAPYCEDPLEIRDMDFCFNDNVYGKLTLIGDVQGETVLYDQEYELNITNNQNYAPRFGTQFPCGFIPETYEIIVYTDSTLSTVAWSYEGTITFDDPYFIDVFDMYPSYVYSFPANKTVTKNVSTSLSCSVLDPNRCSVDVKIYNSGNSVIHSWSYNNVEVSDTNGWIKIQSLPLSYTFTSAGNYRVEYKVTTLANRYHVLPTAEHAWADRTVNFVDTKNCYITVENVGD